jgi:hypothetical protein
MGVLYSVVPLDESIAAYIREVGGIVPAFNARSREPTPHELRAVCSDLKDLKVTVYSPPEHAWQIMIEGLRDPDNEPWTLINVRGFNGAEMAPHSIWFEKGWPSLILRIVGRLAAGCGPLVIVPDTGCVPIVVGAGGDVSALFATWEHTCGVDR